MPRDLFWSSLSQFNSENAQSCIHLTLTRVATVSVPIVAETCARRGAGFSRFLQLVPGEGESQTTGKLCALHFLYKGHLNIASLCNGRTKRKWGAMRNLDSGDRIELFYEDSPEATIRVRIEPTSDLWERFNDLTQVVSQNSPPWIPTRQSPLNPFIPIYPNTLPTVLKAVKPARVLWVRIPPSPPS